MTIRERVDCIVETFPRREFEPADLWNLVLLARRPSENGGSFDVTWCEPVTGTYEDVMAILALLNAEHPEILRECQAVSVNRRG